MPAMAHAFERQAEHAARRGLLQGYRTVEDNLPVLRGRLDVSRQTGRRFRLALPLEVRFDDDSVDLPENRLLSAAARCLVDHDPGRQSDPSPSVSPASLILPVSGIAQSDPRSWIFCVIVICSVSTVLTCDCTARPPA